MNNLHHLLTDNRWFYSSISRKYRNISPDKVVILPITWGVMRLPFKNEVKLASLLAFMLLVCFGLLNLTVTALVNDFQVFTERETEALYGVSVPLITLLCLVIYYQLRVKTSLRSVGVKPAELKLNKQIDIAANHITFPPFVAQLGVDKSIANKLLSTNTMLLSKDKIVRIDVKWYSFYASDNGGSMKKNQIYSFEIALHDGQCFELNSWAFPYSSLLYLLIKFNYPVVLKDISKE
ncbi:hypothetical protein Q4591_17940 [Shewanella sp. 3_MG-2023]|uniref:hypothetical protein n=1 Tax=Shewanella sp. 3_MG-2023 TaxID=3062635 RepID=UPI0026E48694|nr:hypothetical protein [Shewanella sp. 3_MG-2023]MDO6777230.1 hypothetical protein [Shewanella sp. 3_MG-2023]